MPNNMPEDAKRTQILEILESRYFGMIPTRLPNRAEEDQRKDRLSRAVVAFAIQKMSGCSEQDAAAAVVDNGDDNGIDGIYFDRTQNVLYLVQGKIGNAPNRDACLAFLQGITDLLAENYDRFRISGRNLDFDRVQADIEDALDNLATKVVACIVYLGNPLGLHANSDLDRFKERQNQEKSWFDWKDTGIAQIHGWLVKEQTLAPIDVQLTLENWNSIGNGFPRRAVYGLVSAPQLALLYQVHRDTLFARNIRYYLGAQTVNAAIIETVQGFPDELFFFNNGLTAICTHYDFAGNSKSSASFTLQGFSIVNGAQTVGAISEVVSNRAISPNAKLLMTIIEVGNDVGAIELGIQITRTRNTQNAVNRSDFAALDGNQERLRQELAISEVIYHYRPSSNYDPNNENHLTLEEAARALACFSRNTEIVVTAKKEIGQVYDRAGNIYSMLFRDNLTGVILFRQVQIFRYANQLFSSAEATESGRRQMFFRHGGYFILHLWAKQNQAMLNKSELLLSEDDKLVISAELQELAEDILEIAEALFVSSHKGYLSIFRNLTDASDLSRAVTERLNNRDIN